MDVSAFGSVDGKQWHQLTPELTVMPTELKRIEVDREFQDGRFRYLKIQKMNKRSAGLFEPAELRIHGRRHEVR